MVNAWKPVSKWIVPRTFLQEEEDLHWTQVPTPQEGESISSWFTRVTKANCADPLNTFNEITGTRSPFEWIETNLRTQQDLFNALNTVIDKEKITISSRQDAPFNLFFTTNPLPRYCPSCLKRDKEPFFRQIWQIPFVTICPFHRTLLLDSCPSCNKTTHYWKTKLKQPISNCFNCNEKLENAHTYRLSTSEDAIEYFQDDLLEIFNHETYKGRPIICFNFFYVLGKIVASVDPEFVKSLLITNAKTYRKPMDEMPFDSSRMFKALKVAFTRFLEFPALFRGKPHYPITHGPKTLVKMYGNWIEGIFDRRT